MTPLARGEIDPLGTGEELVCVKCGVVLGADEDLEALSLDTGNVRCPECGCEGFIRRSVGRETAVGARWTKALGRSFVALPVTLLRHVALLGLDGTDVMLLLWLESHLWHADGEVYPGMRRAAEHLGLTRRTISRRLARLEERGLIEETGRWMENGRRGTNLYGRQGLTLILDRLAGYDEDGGITPEREEVVRRCLDDLQRQGTERRAIREREVQGERYRTRMSGTAGLHQSQASCRYRAPSSGRYQSQASGQEPEETTISEEVGNADEVFNKNPNEYGASESLAQCVSLLYDQAEAEEAEAVYASTELDRVRSKFPEFRKGRLP